MLVTFTLRPATIQDKKNLFFWRNHEAVRRFSLDSSAISWQTHGLWLEKILANPNQALLIAESGGGPVGVLRFDVEATQAWVSVYLVPEKIGQGYGAHLLLAGIQWMQDQRPEVQRLIAEIVSENSPSIRVFEKAGYRRNTELSTREVLRYEYDFP